MVRLLRANHPTLDSWNNRILVWQWKKDSCLSINDPVLCFSESKMIEDEVTSGLWNFQRHFLLQLKREFLIVQFLYHNWITKCLVLCCCSCKTPTAIRSRNQRLNKALLDWVFIHHKTRAWTWDPIDNFPTQMSEISLFSKYPSTAH